ncbi:hypothetical protein ES332_D11G102100v1 [Gossypium tomentosum]|uniref:ELM2 domain-containing protein n=1 Tax=Gossypium tomentosum TaxID=34277 RepID=A0A5D2IM48_GOSTO|nr:hypothetical protein ES332_D11G102100v1 [Gossypium tomentosum]
MHSSMYNDHPKFRYNLRERSSSMKQLHLGKMASKGLDWSQSSSFGNHSHLDNSILSVDKILRECSDFTTSSLMFNYNVDIQVPIGPLFQAEVLEWTGVALESDAKWLGTLIWPLEKNEYSFLIEGDRIGKGRQDSCSCQIRNSLQCVKFHVAEKRLEVKHELGPAFNQWNFDKMGEEVAFGWNEKEKDMFSSIVKSNPPLGKCFWDEIYNNFHDKSREELVCYYFNVFLLQHRAYQNQVAPNSITYDDEEVVLGPESIGKGIGPKSYTSILIPLRKSQKKSKDALPQFSTEHFDKRWKSGSPFKEISGNESSNGEYFVLCNNLKRKNRKIDHTFNL